MILDIIQTHVIHGLIPTRMSPVWFDFKSLLSTVQCGLLLNRFQIYVIPDSTICAIYYCISMNIYRITCFNGTISNLYQIYEYSMFWLFKHFKTISCVISFNTYLEVDVKYNYISIDIFLLYITTVHFNLTFPSCTIQLMYFKFMQ